MLFQDMPASPTFMTKRGQPQFAVGLTLRILYLIRHILKSLRQEPGVKKFSTTVLKFDEVVGN